MMRLSKLSGLQLVLSASLLAVLMVSQTRADEVPQRIVSVGGAVTEIIYALEQDHRLVARDTTSNFPPAALQLPDVGYIRRLSPEGVLSVDPDLILAEVGAGPPEAVAVLQEASIRVIEIPNGVTVQAVSEKIRAVAAALDVEAKGEALVAKIEAEIALARAQVQDSSRPKVLFVLSLAGGRIMAAGQDTSAESIITLAGGQNALSDFVGFKPVTDEAVSISQADVVLMMDRRGDHAITDADLFANPAIALTPAGENHAVVRMDGMLMLGFSVRTSQAVAELSQALAKVGG